MTLDTKRSSKVYVTKHREEPGIKYSDGIIVLADGKKFSPVNIRQASTLQADIKTCLELWYSTLGQYQTKQNRYYLNIAEEDNNEYCQFGMMHYKQWPS